MPINRSNIKKIFNIGLVPFIFLVVAWALAFIVHFVSPYEMDAEIHLAVHIGYFLTSLMCMFVYVILRLYGQLKISRDEILRNAAYDEITGLPTSKLLINNFSEIADSNKGWGLAVVSINQSDVFRGLFGSEEYTYHLIETNKMLENFATATGTVSYLYAGRFALIFPYNGERKMVAKNLLAKFEAFSNSSVFDETMAKNFTRSYSGSLYFFDGSKVNFMELIDDFNVTIYNMSYNNAIDITDIRNKFAKLKEEITPSIARAFKTNEFKALYQPKYNIITNRIVGVELFSHWIHDGRIIPPADFLPVLNYTGDVFVLDLLVFKTACQTIKRWIDEKIPPVTVAINISKFSIIHKDFINKITEILSEYNIPPSLIEFELSEVALLEDSGTALVDLGKVLTSIGFRLVLDDVDMKVQVAQVVMDSNVSSIKLAPGFFSLSDTSEYSENILKSCVAFFSQLGVVAFADKVETDEHLSRAKRCGCLNAQGYIFCRPMEEDAFFAYFSSKSIIPNTGIAQFQQ